LLFFFKPEFTSEANVNFSEIVQLVLDNFSANQITIGAVAVLSGDYLKDQDIMVKHYGVIADISKNGEAVISEASKTALKEKFHDQLHAGAPVLGGHQFLEKISEINPFSLSTLNDNLGTTRLGSGTYAMSVKVSGKPYIVLNPFHAYQLVPYTTSGHCIVLFEILSNQTWKYMRNDICGLTDPSAAASGSLRKQLLDKKSHYGLIAVDKSSNGIHMSASPLEAMVELQRFFGLKIKDTDFGKKLVAAGLKDEEIEKIKTKCFIGKKWKTCFVF